MRKVFSFFIVILILAVGSSAIADHSAVLTYIHGIPGLPEPLDVFADGNYLFTFDFNESQDSLDVRADTFFIEMKMSGQTLLSRKIELEEGKNYTAIAHLTVYDHEQALSKPDVRPSIKLTIFENDVTPLKNWATRLTLRHTAEAPSMDVAVRRGMDGTKFFARVPGLSNNDTEVPSEFGPVDVWRGYFTPVFFLSGTNEEIFKSSSPLIMGRGFHYIIYSIGSVLDGSFRLFVQAIDLRASEREITF